MNRFTTLFLNSTAVALFVASAFGVFLAAICMSSQDFPALYFPKWLRLAFFLTSGLMLIISAFLLISRRANARLILIAWFSSMALTYHLGTTYFGEGDLFVCAGNFVDWVSISPRVFNWGTVGLLVWMFIGSWGILIWKHFSNLSAAQIRIDSGPAASSGSTT